MRLLDAALVAAISQHAEVFGQDFKGWCAANNVSRSTAYRHKKRIEELGRWERLSTRPKSRPDHQTPPEVEAEIVQLRQELEEQPGHDCGADNVRYYLQQIAKLDDWDARGWRVPSRATIHQIMKRHGRPTGAEEAAQVLLSPVRLRPAAGLLPDRRHRGRPRRRDEGGGLRRAR